MFMENLLRNPCAISRRNADRHLHGTELRKAVVVAPILVGGARAQDGDWFEP